MALIQDYKTKHIEVKNSYLKLMYFNIDKVFYMECEKYYRVECIINRYVDSTRKVILRHYHVDLEIAAQEVTEKIIYTYLKKEFPESKDCI